MYYLRLDLPDSMRTALEQVAADAGQTPEEWVRTLVGEHLALRDDRLRCHFGSVDLGAPTGADNDTIDADLARVYADTGK